MLYSTQEPLQHFPIARDTVKASSTSRVPDPTPFPYASFAVCSLSLPYAYCPAGLAYSCRPTHASVLSSHIDSVTVAAIICYASGLLTPSRYPAGSLLSTGPTVSCRSYYYRTQACSSVAVFPLLLTKA